MLPYVEHPKSSEHRIPSEVVKRSSLSSRQQWDALEYQVFYSSHLWFLGTFLDRFRGILLALSSRPRYSFSSQPPRKHPLRPRTSFPKSASLPRWNSLPLGQEHCLRPEFFPELRLTVNLVTRMCRKVPSSSPRGSEFYIYPENKRMCRNITARRIRQRQQNENWERVNFLKTSILLLFTRKTNLNCVIDYAI